MERILLESQSQNNLMKNSNKPIDIDQLNDSEFKMKNLYSMKKWNFHFKRRNVTIKKR